MIPTNQPRLATNPRPILYVEVKVDNASQDPFVNLGEVRRAVYKWLNDNFLVVRVGEEFNNRKISITGPRCLEKVQSVIIAGHSRPYTDESFHSVAENDLDIAVYSLAEAGDEDFLTSNTSTDSSTQFSVTQLPHKNFDGLWESLIFEEKIPDAMLRIVTRMMRISKRPGLSPAVICWHNLALFHGPPGSGKTTLALALAQKLSIRLEAVYSVTKLVEIKSSSLLDKYYGESGKLVGQMFETVLTMSQEESHLVIVLVDEVETIAGSRERASKNAECEESIRSTNELLQGLDRVRKRPNVVFICTSNMKSNLDSAFLDRCGIEQYIAAPSFRCAYEIFRSVINELIDNDVIVYNTSDCTEDSTLYDDVRYEVDIGDNTSTISARSMHESPGGDETVQESLGRIPDLDWAQAHLYNRPKSAPRMLQSIAELARGLSGRSLRRLPMLAITRYTVEEPCNVHEVLAALKRTVADKAADAGNGAMVGGGSGCSRCLNLCAQCGVECYRLSNVSNA